MIISRDANARPPTNIRNTIAPISPFGHACTRDAASAVHCTVLSVAAASSSVADAACTSPAGIPFRYAHPATHLLAQGQSAAASVISPSPARYTLRVSPDFLAPPALRPRSVRPFHPLDPLGPSWATACSPCESTPPGAASRGDPPRALAPLCSQAERATQPRQL